jgi:cytochrome c556
MMRTVSLALAFGALLVGAVAAQEIKTDDGSGRTALTLTPPEKAYVLDQMRRFVGSIQSITAGLADGDGARAVEAAAARGLKRNVDDPAFPPTLGAKLPAAWKQFGGGMRKGFDTLAQGIADKQDTSQSLRQLGELMNNCVACHASYRIADAKS